MEHMKVLKQIMSNGKKRAYFEDYPVNKSLSKLTKKGKKDQDILSFLSSKPVIQLTKIQSLEKQLKEGKFKAYL
jgi:hypothetical protein